MRTYRFRSIGFLWLAAFTLARADDTANSAIGRDKVAPAIALQALTFAPKDVRLPDGPFKRAMDLDAKFLLTVLTKGKEKVTIKLQAHPGNFAGGLFGCRIVRAD